MPGKYGEELRRMTRTQQGGPATAESSSQGSQGQGSTSGGRRYLPLIGVAVILVLAGVGWIIVSQMMADAKLQNCVMSGKKNCAPLEVEPSGH